MFRHLKLRHSENVAFGFLCVIGVISPVCSVLRCGFIQIMIPRLFGKGRDDITNSTMVGEWVKIWTTAEFCTAATAFCLPSLRAFLRVRDSADSRNMSRLSLTRPFAREAAAADGGSEADSVNTA